MTDTIEIYIDHARETHLVGRCRYVAKRRGQSSVFEYAGEWLDNPDACALEPANWPLGGGQIYTSSEKSALPGALRDSAPDRWGQQLIKRVFRKSGEDRVLSEIDYLLAITDQTRIGALRYKRLNDGGEATYTDIAECIRMYSSAPTADLHELWRRIVFSVLIGNLDDHLRNHGFLYDKDDKWRLSPAYDLNPVPREERARELSTWISEEGPDADMDLARRAAPFFALKDGQATAFIAEVSTALKGWKNAARQLGMSAADIAAYSTAIQSDV